MQKIRLTIVEQMIRSKVTSAEVDFMLYISRYQDDTGLVAGVYYKEICAQLTISNQKFYDIKSALIQKGLIRAEKNSYSDWDIRILNNDFSDQDYSSGYLNTNQQIFQEKSFFQMKAGSKLLAMHLLKICHSNRGKYKIGAETFFETYCVLFGVTKRVMQNYLTELRQFFNISRKNHLYYITPKNSVYKKFGATSEADNYNEHIGKAVCRRTKIRVQSLQAFRDMIGLLKQYGKRLKLRAADCLEQAVHRSLEKLNVRERKKSRWKRVIEPKLVHLCLKEILVEQGI